MSLGVVRREKDRTLLSSSNNFAIHHSASLLNLMYEKVGVGSSYTKEAMHWAELARHRVAHTRTLLNTLQSKIEFNLSRDFGLFGSIKLWWSEGCGHADRNTKIEWFSLVQWSKQKYS